MDTPARWRSCFPEARRSSEAVAGQPSRTRLNVLRNSSDWRLQESPGHPPQGFGCKTCIWNTSEVITGLPSLNILFQKQRLTSSHFHHHRLVMGAVASKRSRTPGRHCFTRGEHLYIMPNRRRRANIGISIIEEFRARDMVMQE